MRALLLILIGGVFSLLALLAQVSPETAVSNLQAWATYVGVKEVPTWLATPSADKVATAVAFIGALASFGAAYWVGRNKFPQLRKWFLREKHAWALRDRLELYDLACLMGGVPLGAPYQEPQRSHHRRLKDAVNDGALKVAKMTGAEPDALTQVTREDARKFAKASKDGALLAVLERWDAANPPKRKRTSETRWWSRRSVAIVAALIVGIVGIGAAWQFYTPKRSFCPLRRATFEVKFDDLLLCEFPNMSRIPTAYDERGKFVTSTFAEFTTLQDHWLGAESYIVHILKGASPTTVIEYALDHFEAWRDEQRGKPFERKFGQDDPIVNESLPFTGKIFIFHEEEMPQVDKKRLWEKARGQGINLIFRDPKYIAEMWKRWGPPDSEPSN